MNDMCNADLCCQFAHKALSSPSIVTKMTFFMLEHYTWMGLMIGGCLVGEALESADGSLR